MTLASVRMPSLHRLTPLTAAIWLCAFGAVMTLAAYRPAYSDPAPSRDTAVAPEPAPPAQRNAPPAKIAPPLQGGGTTSQPATTNGYDAKELTPGHGGNITPSATPEPGQEPSKH